MKSIFSLICVGIFAGFASAQLPKASAAGGYLAAYSAVSSGQSVYLAVGCDPQPGDYTTATVADYPAGRYLCFTSGSGVPVMSRILPVATPIPTSTVHPVGVGIGVNFGTCANGQCGGGVGVTAQFYGRGFFRR